MATNFESVVWGYGRPPVWTLTGALKLVIFTRKIGFVWGAERKAIHNTNKKAAQCAAFNYLTPFIKR